MTDKDHEDEYAPPRPEPGTVVWFPIDDEYGIVAGNGNGVYNSDGELVLWSELQEETKPARIPILIRVEAERWRPSDE